jgi:hypothetical protein
MQMQAEDAAETPNVQSAETAEKWLKAIEQRRSKEKSWRTDKAPAVIRRYRDERSTGESDASKFSILWANVETLKPAIFSRMPVPDVRRRFTTKDPAARTAALMLERAISYCSDAYDLQDTLDRDLEDYLLPGRATCVIRYVPTIEKMQERQAVEPLPESNDDEAQPSTREELEAQFSDAPKEPQYPDGTLHDDQGAYQMVEKENVVYHEVCPDYVPWDLFAFGECKTWKKCPWIAIGALLTKDEVKRRYPDCANDLQYTHTDRIGKDGDHETGHYALLWDVWHKASRKFIVVSEGYPATVFEQDDPLSLEGFYPCPEPMYSVRNNKTWEPKPEFLLYQDQARELDIITDRIKCLIEMLKVRGAYDSAVDNEQFKFSDIMRKPDGSLVPVGNWRALMEKGGLAGVVDFLPFEQIVAALQELRLREQELKQQIYEITGMSDIVRGSSKASETATAQQIKAQYAGLRISTRQQRFQRFVREIFQIMGEIISEHFDPDTLKLMSGIEVVPDMAFQQLKQQKKLPSGAVSETEFMQAIQVLRTDKLRGFKIDIEADSTVPADKQAEQETRINFLQAIAGYLQQAMPAVQQGMIPASIAREGLLFGVRAFKVGSEFEEVLEQLGDDEGDQQNTQQLKQQLQQLQEQNQQLQQQNQQLQQGTRVDMAKVQGDLSIKSAQSQGELAIKARESQQQMALDAQKAQHDMRLDSIERSLQMLLQKLGLGASQGQTVQ